MTRQDRITISYRISCSVAILQRGDGRIVAIEVKLARTVSDEDVRHRRWLQDRIAVIPAALLGP